MKTLGLIGGTSWLSTADYYKTINQLTMERLGRLNSAKILLYSLNFEEFKVFVDAENWTHIGKLMTDIAKRLQDGGVPNAL